MASALRNWLFTQETPHGAPQRTHPWYAVMWLTGVDYFSTIAYQAGIALLAAGALAPIATAILVLVTLFACVPVYAEVSRRSHVGQGSIAMLEHLLPGWWSKLLVLVLLGFAGTDFIITMTLSAADAAHHATQNPYLHPLLHEANLPLTLLLLALLAGIFLMGFREAIAIASVVAIPYVLLNCIIIARAGMEILAHPNVLSQWRHALNAHGDWHRLLLAAAILFPRLALGLSGFETGVSVMPQISPAPAPHEAKPLSRIRNTQKLLLTVALIMSVLLLASSMVTTLLIPESAYREGGEANGRAMAYLAHLLLGNVFGSIYDISTILILWFAGASALAGLLNIIPRYLPRFGMAPHWTAHPRPLILTLFILCVAVTLAFRANVDKQAGAYATGVLALIFSAAFAAALSAWQSVPRRPAHAVIYAAAALVFAYTLTDNALARPDGVLISALFIVLLITMSILSRWRRSTELRVGMCRFADAQSEALWKEMSTQGVNLVATPSLNSAWLERKERNIRRYYRVPGPIAFLCVELMDDRSDFMGELTLSVRTMPDGDYCIEARQANVIANVVAYIGVALQPRAIFIALTHRNLMLQALRYFFSGVGETGLRVYEILVRHWEDRPQEKRPLLFLMST